VEGDNLGALGHYRHCRLVEHRRLVGSLERAFDLDASAEPIGSCSRARLRFSDRAPPYSPILATLGYVKSPDVGAF